MNALLLLAQNAFDLGDLFVGFGILWILMLLLGIAALAIWIWALVDAIQNPALDSTMRIVWIVVIVFTQVIGAIIYLVVGRSKRTASGA
jgi:phospholipase D-like protein